MSTRQTRSPEEVGAEPANTLANGKLKVFVRADLFGLVTESARRHLPTGAHPVALHEFVSVLLRRLVDEVH